MLCWRANRPQGSQLTDYVHMLNLGLVQPVGMQVSETMHFVSPSFSQFYFVQLYYMSIDQPNSVQMIGPFNGTSFAPSFLPVRIVCQMFFCSSFFLL